MRVGSIGCDVECDRHRPCERVVDRRVAVCPIDDLTELALRDPRSGDRHADARAKRARGHGVVHAKQTAIVRLAVDDDLQPRQLDAQVGRPHRDHRGVARRVRGPEEPAGRRGRPSASHTRRHVRHDGCATGPLDPAAQPSFQAGDRSGIGRARLLGSPSQIRAGPPDRVADRSGRLVCRAGQSSTTRSVDTGTALARMSRTGEVSWTYWHSSSSCSCVAFGERTQPVARIAEKPARDPPSQRKRCRSKSPSTSYRSSSTSIPFAAAL
jgi:hypothetical protein